ncbi:MAG TPA: helix-turn-helix transcriptional regulator [Bdellovibrionales bacterium]|nr:helix-turn-helix transcriptional regulator [Bdellovibrionales bacterium]
MERCRRIRRDSDLTVRGMAKQLEVTEGYISSIENGRATPSAKLLMQYIEILGIDHDLLIDSIQCSGPRMNQRQAMIGHCLRLLEEMQEDQLLLVLEILTAVKNSKKPQARRRRTRPPKLDG